MARTMDLGAVKGAEGKSAYQYAQDGGYTGTEEEFRALMAEVPVHVSDTEIHITADERMAWNNKAPSTHASQHAKNGSDPLTLANIAFLGNNPIASTTDDTTTNWVNLGSGYAFFSGNGQLTDQPTTYGFVISFVWGSDIFQIWKSQVVDEMYVRSGNSAGWGQTWAKIYDSQHKPTPGEIGAAASSHNHSASEVTSGTLSAARGGTGQTTVTPAVGTAGVRQIYAGTSDMTAGSTSLTTGVVYFVYE